MTSTEAERHHLIDRAQVVLGPEAAMTLAELLPSSGWSDVARRSDLDDLERRMNLRFDATDARFKAMDARFGARFEAMEAKFDARFEAMEAKVDARFEAMDAKFDARFEAMDAKFDAVDAKFEAAATESAHRFEVVDARFAAMRHELVGAIEHSATVVIRTMVFAMVGTILAVGTLAVALAQLMGSG